MKDAIKPNMVQTLEHNPVLIHGGPFANIAHGCNSILATRTCLKLADYTVTEAGFGADLGAEKFLDIKCRFGGLKPNAVVIVATIRALKQHGNVAYEDLKDENVEAMLTGCENLAKHIDTVKQFGLPYIVAINEFASDTPAEVEALQNWCKEHQHPMSLSQVWAKGGEGALDLANQLVELCAEENSYAPLYDVEQSIEEKLQQLRPGCMAQKKWHLQKRRRNKLRCILPLAGIRCQSVWRKRRCHCLMMRRYMGLRRILRLRFVSCARVLVPVSWLH